MTQLPPMVAAADLTGDGLLDLAIPGSPDASMSVLVNQGGGALAPPIHYGIGGYVAWLAAADLGGDSKPDLAVISRSVDMNANDRVMMLITSCAP